MASLDLVWNLIARDGASPTFLKVGSAAEGTAAKTDLASASIGRLGGAFAGFAAGAAVVAAVKSAEQFQAKMLLIQTQSGATAQEVRNMSPAILSLAGKVAQAPEELATSLYHVESTGLRGAQALEAVKIAAEGARVGHADLEETTNALTATIASGMLPATETYSQAMGALNTIVGSGDMKMQDLNEALGTGVLVTTKQYGVTLNDVGAALADFGDNNIRGADAATSLRMAVQAIQSPGKGAAAALGEIGLTTKQLASDEQTGGLNKALTDLHTHLQNSGIDASQWGQLLTEAFTKKAGGGIMTLIGTFDRFEQKYQEVSKGSDSFGAAWEATTKSTAFQFAALKDSIDAVGIKLGTYLLPILGDLAQGFTLAFAGVDKAITFFTNLPGPVEAGAAALGAFLLLTGPLSGFFETIALKAMYMADTIITASEEGSLAMAALSTAGEGLMSMFGGPWGIAITAVTIGLGYLINWLGKSDDATKATAEATKTAAAAQQTFKQALTDTNGVIDENIRKAAAKALQDDGLLDSGTKAGIGLKSMTDGILGQKDAYDQVIAKLQDYSGALRIQAGFTHDQKNADALNKEADAIDRQVGSYKGLAATQPDAAAGQQQLTDAIGAGADAAQSNADRLTAMGKSASGAKQEVDNLKTSLDVLTGTAVSTDKATADFYAAVDSASGALKDLKGATLDSSGSLDLHTESGRKAFDVLTNVASAGNNLISTMEQQGDTTDQVTAKDAELRQSFIDTEAKMGITGKAAQDLADRIFGIPASRTTEINADTQTAQDKLAAIQADVDAMRGKNIEIMVTAQGGLATYTTDQRNLLYSGGKAAGGQVNGPGTGTSDTAGLFALSKGEWVIKAASSAKYGPAAMAAINAGTAKVTGLAGGGPAIVNIGINETQIDSAVEALKNSMASSGFAPGAPGNVSGNAALGRILAGNQGWGSGAEWNALYALWQRESGWNNNAKNPTSTAYGIPQFLDSTWASVGSRKSSDAATQINAGLAYIRSRYGDPLKAWAHETGAGWYEQGTSYVPRTGPAVLHEGEAVLNKAENAARRGPMQVTLQLAGADVRSLLQGEIVTTLTSITNRGAYNG